MLVIYIKHNPDHEFIPPHKPINVDGYIYNGLLMSALFPVVVIGSTTFIFNMFVTYPFQGILYYPNVERIIRNWKVAIWCGIHWTYGIMLIFVP